MNDYESEDTLFHSLAKICGSKNITMDPKNLKQYSKDMSFLKGKSPDLIIWPSKTQEVVKIIKLANQMEFSIIPVSSSSRYRHHGDTIPRKDNSIIMNLYFSCVIVVSYQYSSRIHIENDIISYNNLS